MSLTLAQTVLRADSALHGNDFFGQFDGDVGRPLPFLVRFGENFGVHMRVADVPEHDKLVTTILGEDIAIDREDIAVALQWDRIIGGENHEYAAAQALENALRQAMPEPPETLAIGDGGSEPGFVLERAGHVQFG